MNFHPAAAMNFLRKLCFPNRKTNWSGPENKDPGAGKPSNERPLAGKAQAAANIRVLQQSLAALTGDLILNVELKQQYVPVPDDVIAALNSVMASLARATH